MSALEELQRRKPGYEEEICNIVNKKEVNEILEYGFSHNDDYSDINNLEVAVTSTGKLITGYAKDNMFYLVTGLGKTLFADKTADPNLKFKKHKELFPRLGVDAYEDLSGSVVKLKDGRIVTMLSDGTILDK